MKKGLKRTIYTIVAAVLCASCFAGCANSCGKDRDKVSTQIFPAEQALDYPTDVKVGYSAEILGTVKRQRPETKDEGLGAYPEYGKQLYAAGEDVNIAEKRALLAENDLLRTGAELATNGQYVETTFDEMDEKGNLYFNGENIHRKLYKHTAAKGMYYGDVSDDEPALIKRISMKPHKVGDEITGLYAPAGEVITIEMSDEDFAATGGLTVFIGQALQNGQANNIWEAREFVRMPVILTRMTTKKAKSYVGSYFGGPIYIKPQKAGVPFTVTITGAVGYRHFILGYTTPEEFEESKSYSAPYFDLEVWDNCVRHSGPLKYAADYSFEDLYNAAYLWKRISEISNSVPAADTSDAGIGFIYDPFVAAGAAVAFVGRNSTNCPPDWMQGSLDYQSFITNGSWGNIHEFNHHYQSYGLPDNTEVSNNATSLVSYSLFTDISSGRRAGKTQDWWNNFLNPQFVLEQTKLSLSNFNSKAEGYAERDTALDAYANILHSFGQRLFLDAAAYWKERGQGNKQGTDAYFEAVCRTTHYDMSWYFEKLLRLPVGEDVKNAIKAENYPAYVPVASVYQTGAGYLYNGGEQFSETARPYVIRAGEDFTLDLSQNLVAPEGFTLTIKSVSNPESGTIRDIGGGKYLYTPSAAESSGKIYVTVGVKRDDNLFEVRDIKLVIELVQSEAENAHMLQRTTYTYDANKLPASVDAAVESDFAGYSEVETGDNVAVNGSNGNAQVWFPAKNTVTDMRGRLYMTSAGKYRISLRGRRFCNLYLSTDGGKSWQLAVKIDDEDVPSGHNKAVEMGKYIDLEAKRGEFIDFRIVHLNKLSGDAYFDLGLAKFDGDSVATPSIVGNAYNEHYSPDIKVYENPFDGGYSAPEEVYSNAGATVLNTTAANADYPTSNVIDGDKSTGLISANLITADKTFSFTVDMGREVEANRIKLYTYHHSNGQAYLPIKFKVYGGISQDEMKLLGDVDIPDAPIGESVQLDFDRTKIRYYKIDIEDMNAHRYTTFAEVELSNALTGGKLISPDDSMISYFGDWNVIRPLCTFGHVLSTEGGAAEFTFTGRGFAIYSSSEGFSGYDVYIDGEKVGSAASAEGKSGTFMSYIFDGLTRGNHKVRIESASSFNIDSIAVAR